MTNLPAHLQNQNVPRLAERTIGNLGAAQPPYVSIKNNRFTLIDASGDQEPITTVDPKTGAFYLDCVIIDALERESKIYYGKAFDPNAETYAPPACWSDNGIAPSRQAGSPQSPTCAACPQAEWGSAVSKASGKGIPACGKYQKLALMTPGDDVLFLLRVPPNSLKHLRDYLAKFKGQPYDTPDVLTRIMLDKDTIGTLHFQAMTWIDEATAKQRAVAYQSKATDILVGRGDQPREGVARVESTQHPVTVIDINAPSQLPGNAAIQPGGGMTIALMPGQTIPQLTPIQQATNGATVAQPEPQRRRRRTKAEMEADNVKQPGGPATSAPFQAQTTVASPQQAPFQAAPMPGGAPFGIQAGVAPDAELSKTIDGLFPPQ